jgi:plastocyanin
MRSIASACRFALLVAVTTFTFPLTADAAGSITGTIKLDGPVPQRQAVEMSKDPQCQALNQDGRLDDVFLVKDGKVRNVFVYIKEGLGDQKFDIPAGSTTHIDQVGCMFEPRVIGVMVGQEFEFRNSDPTLHNVHSLPSASRAFNNAMPMKGMTLHRKFTAPEVMVRIKCDVHPWMAAYVGVLSHPFFAVSGEDGTFTITNVPPGTYTIEAWHEKMGTQTASVTVADGSAANADFTFKAGAQ